MTYQEQIKAYDAQIEHLRKLQENALTIDVWLDLEKRISETISQKQQLILENPAILLIRKNYE